MEPGTPRYPSLPQQSLSACRPPERRPSPERTLMKTTRTVGLALAAVSAGALLFSAPDSAAAPKNVSRWVTAAPRVGAAADSQMVHFSMFLGFKNKDGLKAL